MQIVSPGVVDPDFRRPYSGLDEMIPLLLQKFKLEVAAEAVRVEVHLPAQAVILNLGRGEVRTSNLTSAKWKFFQKVNLRREPMYQPTYCNNYHSYIVLHA